MSHLKIDPEKDKPYWVAFNNFWGIGPVRFKLLREFFGSAQKAWEAPPKKLLNIGLGEKLTNDFCQFRQNFAPRKYFATLGKKEIAALTLAEKEYPPLLAQIKDAPPVLYLKSDQNLGEIFSNLALAVVGTRKISSYGRQVTEILVRDLVAQGLTIISGMARGVDSIAHQTALEVGGKTIAILGSGVETIYPPENQKLSQEIVKNGAVISEFPPHYPALPGNFPTRNRIIAGLSQGVLVTEAAEDSGSLITASWAADYGREVFAVPGPITSPLSKGTAELIKKGAKLVWGVKDILEELNLEVKILAEKGRKILPESEEEEIILKILEGGALHFDEIVRQAGMETAQVGSLLTLMEIKGKVKNLGQGEYGLGNFYD